MEKMLKVEGMHCRSCEMLLADVISEIEGVEKASASRIEDAVRVVCKDEKTLESVRKAIEGEGYRVV